MGVNRRFQHEKATYGGIFLPLSYNNPLVTEHGGFLRFRINVLRNMPLGNFLSDYNLIENQRIV